jgi:hypothetical protein
MGGDDPSVAAQAVEFIRALRVQLREMTGRLTWIERQGVTGKSSREIRLEAAALRRDITEAKVLIDRLQRLRADATSRPSTPAGSPAWKTEGMGRSRRG